MSSEQADPSAGLLRLSAAEQLLYSTVHIGSGNESAEYEGTGFFYNITLPGNGTAPALITNKHVIEGCDRALIHMHRRDDQNNPAGWDRVAISITDRNVLGHPLGDVDLCAISINMQGLEEQGFSPFAVFLDKNLIPTPDEWEQLDALEQILMVGCPNGLFDEANNLPIFRRGITASHPARRFNGADEFMIDAACFPGSSGSPVLLYDGFGYRDKKTGDYMMGQTRVKLLGILFGGPTITQDGQITLAVEPKIHFQNLMHLGQVIRSSRLIELEEAVLELMKQQGTP